MTIQNPYFNDADTEALLNQIACWALGPAVHQRIQMRGNKIIEEIREKLGTIEIGVQLIREARNESAD